MKKLASVIVLGFAMATAFAQAAPEDKEVLVNVGDVFVPGGFDTGSDVFVVESGVFPNGCYSWKGAEVTHISPTLHEVRSIASVQQGMCIMVLVPFTKEVRLGKFESGDHTLRFINGDGTYLEKRLNIE